MRIGLIADSHVPSSVKELWPQVKVAFEGVDLILHAGDIYDPVCLDWLEEIAPVVAAKGNGDSIFLRDPRVKATQVIEVAGRKIGMVHILYYPDMAVDKVMDYHFGGPVDVIVFGDSHFETIERNNGVLLVNPGSPTLPHQMTTRLGTVGILDITTEGAEARIVELKDIGRP